ncbi:hypothetical protein [Pseudarthrobacter sp. MEB009]|uniref:hypothetical protein n=1 Tax=Pseudarthrobacter sp. MEB009 TaxID=3040326 RepID=UPI0025577EB5|nr:hypothetical protein [Pseudarthrobacter sp. MEB009]
MNTRFNNPRLPRVPLPGWADNFNRAAGDAIGVTSAEKRPWKVAGTIGNPIWSITSTGGVALTAATSGLNVAVADGLATNGTLTVTAKALGTSRRGGLAFRYRDIDNHYAIYQAANTSTLNLHKRINGNTATVLATSTYTPSDGDVYQVVLNNDTITVKVNGTTIITATDNAFTGETWHGLYGSSQALSMVWDDASFVAAA